MSFVQDEVHCEHGFFLRSCSGPFAVAQCPILDRCARRQSGDGPLEERRMRDTGNAVAGSRLVPATPSDNLGFDSRWGHRSSPRGLRASGNYFASLREALDRHVDRSAGPGACWPWTARRDRKGYGKVNFRGRTLVASRCALEVRLRRKLPTTVQARHRCDNPPCCNPAHLRPGSNRDNVIECVGRGRGDRGGRLLNLLGEDSWRTPLGTSGPETTTLDSLEDWLSERGISTAGEAT